MKTHIRKVSRLAYGSLALALTAAVTVPSLVSTASAGQFTDRQVMLSSSVPSSTGNTYQASFKPTSTATIGGLVVDFCANTPIIGDTSCTYPAGLNLGGTPAVTVGGVAAGGTWVSNGIQGGAGAGQSQAVRVTNTTAVAPTGVGTDITVTITGVTNPSTTGTFYVRLMSFDTAANANSAYSPTGTTRGSTFTGQRDYGGAAVSTANQIDVTARVMETLTFCASTADPGTGCTGTNSPSFTLGHGPNLVLDSTAVDTASIFTQTSTNASSGATVRLNSNRTCGGLSSDNGATCGIAARGALAAITNGQAVFGVRTATSGAMTADPTYAHATNYAMDQAEVSSTYGSPILSSNTQLSNVENTLTFGASAATTTPAGLYTAQLNLVATGTY